MATAVNLPALGESVTEGTVTRWLKQVGDEVAVDEPLLEVSTDKVDTEIPSPVAGTLLEIKADEDDTVEVGAELALIGDEGESGGRRRRAGRRRAGPAVAPRPQPSRPRTRTPTSSRTARPRPRPSRRPRRPTTPAGPGDGARSLRRRAGGRGSKAGTSGGGPSTSVTLPALGESVTEGTVTRWLK